MNDLKTVVRYFEMRWEGKTDFEALAMCDRRDMERTALAALRDALRRQEGCERCAVTCYVCVRGADGGCGYWANCSRANVKHEGNPHDQDLYKPKAYCDKCGRKLKEGANE